MTAEEQTRMNALCAGIQEEVNYERFAAMLHEMSELIERKERRRFPHQPKIVWARNKPWASMHAQATKVVPSIASPRAKVEISIPAADDLFREIRIDNQLTGVDGKPVVLTAGVQVTLTVEAESPGTMPVTN
jgi:hypothetical protein